MKQMTIIVPIMWKTKVMEINTALDKPLIENIFYYKSDHKKKGKPNYTVNLFLY